MPDEERLAELETLRDYLKVGYCWLERRDALCKLFVLSCGRSGGHCGITLRWAAGHAKLVRCRGCACKASGAGEPRGRVTVRPCGRVEQLLDASILQSPRAAAASWSGSHPLLLQPPETHLATCSSCCTLLKPLAATV